MTTLKAIGFTLAGGSVFFCFSFISFGLAVSRRSEKIAPRCTARPKNVIYNPSATAHNNSPQYRGNPVFGWIPWTLRLSYDTLLRGVPGTGTRQGGLSGTLLHVTLDGIVLLRFHALGRRIAALATALCLFLLLPLYLSAPCLPDYYGNNKYMEYYECNATRISNYRTTTLSHVPDLEDGMFGTAGSEYSAILMRLYTSVAVIWAITLYSFQLLRTEWKEMVQLRRIYYLERRDKESSQEWRNRLCQSQQQRRIPSSSSSSFAGGVEKEDEETAGLIRSRSSSMGSFEDTADPEEEHLSNRDPWIPHPEQPDTVPNVEPYSVLLGHIPSLLQHPNQQQHASSTSNALSSFHSSSSTASLDTMTATMRSDQIQRQLRLIQATFEKSIPHEPGYSSPVVAITMLPCAHQVGVAWRKWYSTAAKMRRLKLIRQQIEQRRSTGSNSAGGGSNNTDTFVVANGDSTTATTADEANAVAVDEDTPVIKERMSRTPSSDGTTKRQKQSQQRQLSPSSKRHERKRLTPYFLQVLGTVVGEEDLKNDAAAFGPEQTAVYSRELAQAASNFCPYGCMEGRVRTSNLEQLLDQEAELELELHRAKQELDYARRLFLTLPEPSSDDDDNTINGETGGCCASPDGGHTAIIGSGYDFTSATSADGGGGVEMSDLPSSRSRDAATLSAAGGAASSEGAAVVTKRVSPSYVAVPTSPSLYESQMQPLKGAADNGSVSIGNVGGGSGVAATAAAAVVRARRLCMWMVEEIKTKRWKILPEIGAALTRESSYAVVTFTSRQAAAAARQCLLDGNQDVGRLMTLHGIPIPPLADAAPWALYPCRYFCRPVTVTLNKLQKSIRFYVMLGWLGLMYIFYTIPLTYATKQVDKDSIAYLFPDHMELSKNIGVSIPELFSGILTSMIWSFFFMMCPQVFKLTAYFGSKATSLAQAERRALQYFWWFMVLTAFTGPMLAMWIIGAVSKREEFGEGLRQLLIHLAGATPTLIAVSWLNWIIYRFTIIIPINFLLQFNTFLFSFLGWNCCSRVTIGGGPGGPVPYRIFVDSGVVLMCAVALGPASPLVAPAALAYFCFCEPVLRRNVIFVYRPRYDDGGLRWMFIFDMIISALVVGQLLLALQMGLKNAFGPGLLASAAIPATIWFQWHCKRKYEPAFENTALLRTTLLDGWDSLDEMSMERREEHRRFLVDAHKAAYIPVCIAGSESAAILTDTPAMVVPHSIDSGSDRGGTPPPPDTGRPKIRRQTSQTPEKIVSTSLPNSTEGLASSTMQQDAELPISPFDAGLMFRANAKKI